MLPNKFKIQKKKLVLIQSIIIIEEKIIYEL
jgi:hypothetical protein